mmetsp:Transcript_21581/g.25521  ORF Transcript_21581/g.25521 Transcript_21581/m.25521 type:complete len:225 (+) Transcript_21581:181-855(+)
MIMEIMLMHGQQVMQQYVVNQIGVLGVVVMKLHMIMLSYSVPVLVLVCVLYRNYKLMKQKQQDVIMIMNLFGVLIHAELINIMLNMVQLYKDQLQVVNLKVLQVEYMHDVVLMLIIVLQNQLLFHLQNLLHFQHQTQQLHHLLNQPHYQLYIQHMFQHQPLLRCHFLSQPLHLLLLMKDLTSRVLFQPILHHSSLLKYLLKLHLHLRQQYPHLCQHLHQHVKIL